MGRAPRRNAALALGMAALIVTGGAETITERMKRVKAEYKAAQEAGQGKEWEQKLQTCLRTSGDQQLATIPKLPWDFPSVPAASVPRSSGNTLYDKSM